MEFWIVDGIVYNNTAAAKGDWQRVCELLKIIMVVYVSVVIGLGPDAAAMHVYMSQPVALCSMGVWNMTACAVPEHWNLKSV